MIKRLALIACMLTLFSCSSVPQELQPNIQARATAINDALVSAREGLKQLRLKAVAHYAARAHFSHYALKGKYKYYEGSVFYKAEDDGLCGVWASGYKPIGQEERFEIEFIEALQPDIKQFVLSHPLVEFGYFLTTDHIAFFYPYIEGISFFEPGVDFNEAYIPYYGVSPRFNPDREARWIKPYIDAAGNGYICSISTPVYSGDEFKGAVGADIPLIPLGEDFLDPGRMQMVITEDTTLFYGTATLLDAIPLKALDKFYYTKTVIIDEYASDEFQMARHESPEIRELARLMLEKDTFDIRIGTTNYTVFVAHIPETGWRAVELVKNN